MNKVSHKKQFTNNDTDKAAIKHPYTNISILDNSAAQILDNSNLSNSLLNEENYFLN